MTLLKIFKTRPMKEKSSGQEWTACPIYIILILLGWPSTWELRGVEWSAWKTQRGTSN